MPLFRKVSWQEAFRAAPDERLRGAVLEGPSGTVAPSVQPATTPFGRVRGLLGRAVGPETALLLAPCKQVHTVGMRDAIDAVFCDRDLVVLATQTLPPGKMSRTVRRAWCCFELPAGAARSHGIAEGVRLALHHAPDGDGTPRGAPGDPAR